jgi:hypothetical protein
VFKRKKRPEEAEEEVDLAEDEFDAEDELAADDAADEGEEDELFDDGEQADAGAIQPRAEPAGPGPYDAADAPDDAVVRADLGGLRVPVLDGFEVRVDVDQESQAVVAATLVTEAGAVQLSAFAAPRSEGIWPEVRQEIVQTLRAEGGGGEEVDGPFGLEVRARVADPDGDLQPVRFVGVDGPRWFLRGLVSGPAATDRAQAQPLEQALRQVVVVRGSDPMAPRDPLPLRLPPTEDEGDGGPGDPGGGPGLNPFERGPEITEVR